jgi:hypothetical protein
MQGSIGGREMNNRITDDETTNFPFALAFILSAILWGVIFGLMVVW